MRTFQLAILLCFLQFNLAAQNDIIVLHVSGQVLYYAHFGAKPVQLYPGLELSMQGKVRCKGSGSAKLLYNGATILLTGTKTRDVQDVIKAANPSSQMGFTGRFFEFVTKSVREGENNDQLEKHHRRYMNKASGGIKGWAIPGYAIKPLLIATGKLPSANVIFKWRNAPEKGPYTFWLQGADGKQVAQLLVRDTFVTLDLEQLSMDIFAEYEWGVKAGENAKSVAIPIEICPDKTKEIEAELSREATYKSADPTERQLMLAYSLEEEHCFYSANNTYANLLAADPDNWLLRKMYATFLARMDMLPEAYSLLLSHPK